MKLFILRILKYTKGVTVLIAFLKGFGAGSGLIIAIGAQNAFVLSQGIKKNHYIVIPLICAVCDALLITLGVTGMGLFLASSRTLSLMAGLGGAVFLFLYGLRSFKSALAGGSLSSDEKTGTSLKTAVLTTLAVTLLNPHVYLDTVVLLGSLSSQFHPPAHLYFGAGAVMASFSWFFALGVGGRLLAPVFTREVSWRVLNSLVGITMWVIAGSVLKALFLI
jgi:L-lysine exporter family protein LysE/ArgO